MLSQYLRKVHPPVDATTLAGIVRHVLEEEEENQEAAGETVDDILTEAYNQNGEKSGEDDRPTMDISESRREPDTNADTEPAIERAEIDRIDSESGSGPAVAPDDDDAVVISQIVIVEPKAGNDS